MTWCNATQLMRIIPVGNLVVRSKIKVVRIIEYIWYIYERNLSALAVVRLVDRVIHGDINRSRTRCIALPKRFVMNDALRFCSWPIKMLRTKYIVCVTWPWNVRTAAYNTSKSIGVFLFIVARTDLAQSLRSSMQAIQVATPSIL